MMSVRPTMTVGEIVAQWPSSGRVFENYGIDYCCGGKRPLSDVCREKSLNPEAVLHAIEQSDGAAPDARDIDWRQASMTVLTNHIESTHHTYLKQELPRLGAMIDKVASVHGQRHPEMIDCRDVFHILKSEMETHMAKEEQSVFRMICALETSKAHLNLDRGSIQAHIRELEQEHDGAGTLLAGMKKLTHDFTPPADACNTFRVLLDGLAQLDRDMHQHIHKENNILFPRAIETEARFTVLGPT